MYITQLDAKNYRTLVDFKIGFSYGYCAISGKNNCGKTSIIKIIEYFLNNEEDHSYYRRNHSVKHSRDRTQWIDAGDDIDISITLRMLKDGDSELFGFIQRMGSGVGDKSEIDVKIRSIHNSSSSPIMSCYVDGLPQDNVGSAEIIKKIRSSSNLIVHNSTNNQTPFYYVGESFVEIIEAHFSQEDRDGIAAAQKGLQSKIRKATKQHKAELDALLGMLKDKFQVELSSIGSEQTSRYPLQIKLNDKVAEVPLHEWGAGTQNRTRVFLSILEAQHTKQAASEENRSTPVFLVEEPESFLHPSAQAEFGQILNSLAKDFGIQIIATTHSPYMLNQSDPTSNYLLDRKIVRKLPRETVLQQSDEKDWMMPFAENLGVVSSEFHDWKNVFSAKSSRVVLLEGEIDKDYFEFIRSNYPAICKIPEDVEFVPYEGKDALKNTALLRFMINKFKRVFIAYDLDADKEVGRSLQKIGLGEGVDYSPVGQNKAGCDCIEGLIPDSIKIVVHANNMDDVNSMMSSDNNIRKPARQRLKKAYLAEFRNNPPKEGDLSHFKALFSKIAHAFS